MNFEHKLPKFKIKKFQKFFYFFILFNFFYKLFIVIATTQARSVT